MRSLRHAHVYLSRLEPGRLAADSVNRSIRILQRVRPLIDRPLRPERALAVRSNHRTCRRLRQVNLVPFHQVTAAVVPRLMGYVLATL